jgi:type II secretory pathway predicted ATPase ExeA
MARSGLTVAAFARVCSRSPNAVRYFLDDRYSLISETDLLIRRDLEQFMALHPLLPESDQVATLHRTRNYDIMRRVFYSALSQRRAYCVQGDPGTQKTYLAKYLIADLNRRELAKNGVGRRAYRVRCRPNMRPLQLLKAIAQAAAVRAEGDTAGVLRQLRFAFGTRSVLIVFDEAQLLSVDCMETVRELLDEPPYWGLLFIGSHEIERFLTMHSIELEQWNSRLYGVYTLPGIDQDEAIRIIKVELGEKASRKVIDELVKKSRTPHLRDSKKTYISARRLFYVLDELRADRDAGEQGEDE